MADPDNTGGKQADTLFKPGVSGNPTGRPKGSRNKLGDAFIADLHEKWQTAGSAALDKMAADDPSGFVRVVAGLLPKEFKIETTSDLTDEQLDARIRHLASLLEVGVGQPAGGEKAPDGSKPPGGLPAVH